MALVDDLFAIKRQIAEARTEHDQLQGRLNALYEKLQKEYGCKTLKEATKLVSSYKQEIGKLDEELLSGVDKLKEYYDASDAE